MGGQASEQASGCGPGRHRQLGRQISSKAHPTAANGRVGSASATGTSLAGDPQTTQPKTHSGWSAAATYQSPPWPWSSPPPPIKTATGRRRLSSPHHDRRYPPTITSYTTKCDLTPKGGQDADGASDRRRRGVRLPRLPPSAGADTAASRDRRAGLPCLLAFPQGGEARPRPHPLFDDAGQAGHADRADLAVSLRLTARHGSGSFTASTNGSRQDQDLRRATGRAIVAKAKRGRCFAGLPLTGQPGTDSSPEPSLLPEPKRPWRARSNTARKDGTVSRARPRSVLKKATRFQHPRRNPTMERSRPHGQPDLEG